ncbi:putative transcriptional regulatory protein YebC [Streptomyces misionensis JCM 4497]
MGYDEAQEGRDRRQARQALREADQEHRGRGADGRRRPRRQPDALRRRPEGQEAVGPEQEHRLRDQARRRSRGRRRRLRDDHVRGLRPQRCRGAHRVPHRQPQPRRLRRACRHDPQRRLHGRPRLGVVPVQPQGRRDRPQGRADRGRRARCCPGRRCRGGQRPRRVLRGAQRGHRPGRGPHRPPGGRHRLRLGRGQLRPDHAGRAGRGGRQEDLQADRRPGGQRRRAERLRQLRRERRDHGEGRRVARAAVRPGRRDTPSARRVAGRRCAALSVPPDSLHKQVIERSEGGAPCGCWGWTRD